MAHTVVNAFPDGQSALMLCATRLRHIAGIKMGYETLPLHGGLTETTFEEQLTA